MHWTGWVRAREPARIWRPSYRDGCSPRGGMHELRTHTAKPSLRPYAQPSYTARRTGRCMFRFVTRLIAYVCECVQPSLEWGVWSALPIRPALSPMLAFAQLASYSIAKPASLQLTRRVLSSGEARVHLRQMGDSPSDKRSIRTLPTPASGLLATHPLRPTHSFRVQSVWLAVIAFVS